MEWGKQYGNGATVPDMPLPRDIERWCLQAGLRAHERVVPGRRLPMRMHSGVLPAFCSFTVAGAASELLCGRTDFPFHSADDCPWNT